MKIRQLSKSYGSKQVVDSVSFSVPQGKVTALIGPNGAGKSTVMHLISRLILRDSGSVELEGKDITQWKSRDLAKQLAILTQSNHTSMKLTIRELVSFGRFPHSGNQLTPADEQMIDSAIAYMELDQIEHSYLDELSGGQRQRAYIAMVIAQDTQYVLLDEPTNNLDIYHATQLMKTVRRLCDELGKTVVVVLHDINFASFYADYVCVLAGGKLVEFGPVEQVITKETLSQVYGVAFDIQQVNGKPLLIYY